MFVHRILNFLRIQRYEVEQDIDGLLVRNCTPYNLIYDIPINLGEGMNVLLTKEGNDAKVVFISPYGWQGKLIFPGSNIWIRATFLPLRLIPPEYRTEFYVSKLEKILKILEIGTQCLSPKLVIEHQDIGESWVNKNLWSRDIKEFKVTTSREGYVQLIPNSLEFIHSDFQSFQDDCSNTSITEKLYLDSYFHSTYRLNDHFLNSL
jgi:hypothetical protein